MAGTTNYSTASAGLLGGTDNLLTGTGNHASSDAPFAVQGGYIFDAVLLRCNAFARVALCGMIAGYDGAPLPMANPALILINRLKIEGFIVSEHIEVWPEALAELGALVGSGKLRPRETVAQGIEAAPQAFLGLLKGKNFGKQLVRVGD